MQQKEGKSTPTVSCQDSNVLHASEESSEFTYSEESHGESHGKSTVQVVPGSSGVYTLHDNESFEYDNNQEREFVSDDLSFCQKMNSFVSDPDRNMVMTFSKGSLTEKKEGLLLGNTNSKQMAANSSDSEAQKSSQLATPSQPDTLVQSDEDTWSSAADYDSSYVYDKITSNKKLVCGFILKGMFALSLVVCLLCSMHQPQIAHPHNHKNTTGQESHECSKETKRSADKVGESSMICFCLPSEEPGILDIDHQCPTTDPSIQQCVAEDFDDTSWSPFGKADESMCLVDGDMHYGPESPFKDLTTGKDIPKYKYKERMDSSYFGGSIHLLPMDKISLPSLVKKKRKKRSQCKSKKRQSRATVEISTPKPMPSHGTSTRYSAVLLFQLLVLLYFAVPVSVPLQEHGLLSDKKNKPSDQTGLANYATFTNYQVIEMWTFIDVIVIGLALLLYMFRQTIKSYVIKVWPDCQRWLVDAFKRIGCRSRCYLQKALISAYRRLTASARTLVIKFLKVLERAMKKMLKKVRSVFTISHLVSVVKLLFRCIAGQFRRWMRVQLAEYNEPQQPHDEPLPSDFQPLQPLSELHEQSIHQPHDQAKHPPSATSSDYTANSLDQHQVTNSSPHEQNFANLAQKSLEEASRVETADEFSASCSPVYPSTLDYNGVSPPYREHTDTFELTSGHDGASVQHKHSGSEMEGSQYSTVSSNMGIHLEAKPCEPITCSDQSSNSELVCPRFIRRSWDGSGLQSGEFTHPFQPAVLNNQNNFTTHENFAELTTIVPQDVTSEIPIDPPTKLLSFNTSMSYNLKTLQCVRMAKENPLPPDRCPINFDCNMMCESLGHDATLYTLVLSEANREAIQLQNTPYLVCLCRQEQQ